MSTNEKPTQVQGEGDYESTRKYDADTKRFIETHDVSDLAKRAAPDSSEEAAKLDKAEEAGRSRAVGGKDAESWPKDKAKGKDGTRNAGS